MKTRSSRSAEGVAGNQPRTLEWALAIPSDPASIGRYFQSYSEHPWRWTLQNRSPALQVIWRRPVFDKLIAEKC